MYLIFIEICHFYRKERNSENVISSFLTFITKKTVAHIKALKQALNHGLILKKVPKIIRFNKKGWLKAYIT